MTAIGSRVLLRQLFIKKVDLPLITTGDDQEIPVETLDADQHAFYIWSVFNTDQQVVDVWQTAGVVGPGSPTLAGGIHTSLEKRRTIPVPRSTDVILHIFSTTAGLHLEIKVYRIAGLD